MSPQIVEAGALPIFNIMLQKGDAEQQESAARAIWGLAFDDNARKRILAEPELMQNLELLTASSPVEGVKKTACGAMWILKKELDHRTSEFFTPRLRFCKRGGTAFSSALDDIRKSNIRSGLRVETGAVNNPYPI